MRLSTLTLGDLRYLLPSMTDKQHHFLGQAYDALKKEKKGQPWTAKELKRHVSNVGHSTNDDSGDDSGNSTVAALHWKIDERLGNNNFVFDPILSIWICVRCSSRANAPCSSSTRSTSATSR